MICGIGVECVGGVSGSKWLWAWWADGDFRGVIWILGLDQMSAMSAVDSLVRERRHRCDGVRCGEASQAGVPRAEGRARSAIGLPSGKRGREQQASIP